MKKVMLISFVLLCFGFVPHAFAQFVSLTSIPGLTDIQPTTGGLAAFFNNLYKYLIGLSAALAVIMIIWGGLLYSTQDSVGNKEEGKEKIKGAIFGLVLVLSPVLVFSIINPAILNLSLNLPPIGTVTGAAIPTGTTGPAFGGSIIQSTYTQTCGQYTGLTALLPSSTQTCASLGKVDIPVSCCSSGSSNTFSHCCALQI